MAGKNKQAKKISRDKSSKETVEEVDLGDPVSELEVKLGAVFIFSLSVSIYFITAFPGLPMGDSGEFMVTAIDMGVAHPPGYPLFTTLSYLAIHLVPFGTPAWRVSLLSILHGGLFNVTIYYFITRVGRNPFAGVVTAGWIGFSRLFWMWSIQGEIFSLNNFFCAFIMLRAYYFEKSTKDTALFEAKISALTCGLSLSNQHTSVLFIIPFALRVAYRMILTERCSLRDVVNIALFGLLGMSWYIQMPLSHFFFTPRVTWGDFGSVKTFLNHMLRLDYGSSFKLVAGDTQSSFISNFLTFIKDSSTELTAIPLLLAGLVVYSTYRPSTPSLYKRTITTLLLMLGCYFTVFCSLANIENPVGMSRGVLERFWMQPSIGLAILGGLGLCKLINITAKKLHPMLQHKYVLLPLALALISLQIQLNYEENDESGNWYGYHYAHSILPDLPPHSIILTGGDLPTNVFRYHTICEGMRADVRVLDMQFMAADWFRDVLAPTTFAGITIPGVYRPYNTEKLQEGQYNLVQFLDLNIDKFAIFVCNTVRKDASNEHQKKYLQLPYRTCRQFVRRADIENPVTALEKLPTVELDAWPMPDMRRYEDRTWEHNLKVAYLTSLADRGIMLWHEAVATKHAGNRRFLLEHGAYHHKLAVQQVETAMAEGRLLVSDWQYVATSIAKNMGHYCMILHTMVAEEGQNEEKRQELEDCGRKYWQIFVDYSDGTEEAVLISKLRDYLSQRSMADLRFNI